MLCLNVAYDPIRDRSAVDPYGFINLRDSYLNGNVPTTVDDSIANYNGIDDPESILGTPKDIFEGYRMRDRILRESGTPSKVLEGSVMSNVEDTN